MVDWICRPDSDVPVVYGDSFPMSGDTADTNAIGHLKYVLNDVNDIRISYFMLGFHLSEIKRYNVYEKFGYDNMKDFCLNNVPVDYTVLTRCISVYEKFCAHDGESFYSNRLNPCYEGFSFSQLVELLGLSFSSIDLPRLRNYSVSKLRDLKKFCLSKYGRWGYNSNFLDNYEESLNVVDNCDVATDSPESGNCDVATGESSISNRDFAIIDKVIANSHVVDKSEPSNCDVSADAPESGNCDVATEKSKEDKEAEIAASVLARLERLKGSVLYSFVRGFPTSRKLNVTLYDVSGKKVFNGALECDVLYSDDDTLHIRSNDDALHIKAAEAILDSRKK